MIDVEGSSLPNSSKSAVRHDRRGILKTGAAIAGTAALLSAIKAVTPAGAWAAGTDGIEKPKLNLGFIPLTDCAPLVVASEKGFFKKHSLTSRCRRKRPGPISATR